MAFEIIQFSKPEFCSAQQLNSTGSAVLHGSGTAQFQTSRVCRAELN